LILGFEACLPERGGFFVLQLFNYFEVFRRILLRKTGMPVPGAPFRLGHCCDLYGSADNPPGHPCGSLKKDNNVCPDRNVPQGHNHGHASRHYPSPLGLNLKSSKALVHPALMQKPK
jgi:hypothetical protein